MKWTIPVVVALLVGGGLYAWTNYRQPAFVGQDAPKDSTAPTVNTSSNPETAAMTDKSADSQHVERSEAEWRELLTPMQYYVTREKGTERAYTGEYWNNKEKGRYDCVCCGLPLFDSETKYESGTGWPSFYAPVDPEAVRTEDDSSWLMRRTEVLCRRCDAHLGHVFPDGPRPTGLRYCMNSAALKFQPADADSPTESEK